MIRGDDMTVKMIMVTYDGDKRIEEPWENIQEERKVEIGAELTDRFMKSAGFSPAVPV